MIDLPTKWLIAGLLVDLTLLLICPRERWSQNPNVVIWGLITIVVIWPIVVLGTVVMIVKTLSDNRQ